jgi:hypothetical protein
VMWSLGVLLGCAENAQRLRCPVQIDMEHLDRQDHCHILPEDNAMGDVFNNEESAHLVTRLLIGDGKKLAQTCRGVLEVKPGPLM